MCYFRIKLDQFVHKMLHKLQFFPKMGWFGRIVSPPGGGLILLLILTNPDLQGHGQNLVNIKLCISDSLNLSVSCGIVDLLKHFIWTGKGNWSTGPTGETTCNSKTPKILQHLGTFTTLIFNTSAFLLSTTTKHKVDRSYITFNPLGWTVNQIEFTPRLHVSVKGQGQRNI